MDYKAKTISMDFSDYPGNLTIHDIYNFLLSNLKFTTSDIACIETFGTRHAQVSATTVELVDKIFNKKKIEKYYMVKDGKYYSVRLKRETTVVNVIFENAPFGITNEEFKKRFNEYGNALELWHNTWKELAPSSSNNAYLNFNSIYAGQMQHYFHNRTAEFLSGYHFLMQRPPNYAVNTPNQGHVLPVQQGQAFNVNQPTWLYGQNPYVSPAHYNPLLVPRWPMHQMMPLPYPPGMSHPGGANVMSSPSHVGQPTVEELPPKRRRKYAGRCPDSNPLDQTMRATNLNNDSSTNDSYPHSSSANGSSLNGPLEKSPIANDPSANNKSTDKPSTSVSSENEPSVNDTHTNGPDVKDPPIGDLPGNSPSTNEVVENELNQSGSIVNDSEINNTSTNVSKSNHSVSDITSENISSPA